MACILDTHPDRDQIDAAIIAGAPTRYIAAQYNVAVGTAHRHKQCIKDAIREARSGAQEERAEHGSDLLQRVLRLASEAEEILVAAKATANLKAATAAIGSAVRVLELVGRLDGSLAQPNAPGLHLSFTSNKVVNLRSYGDDDVEFATMIAEATNGFDPIRLEQLKRLAQAQENVIMA